MSDVSFAASEPIRESWKLLKREWKRVYGLGLVAGIPLIMFYGVFFAGASEGSGGLIGFSYLFMLAYMYTGIGLVLAYLKLVRGESVQLREVFAPWKVVWPIFLRGLASYLMFLLVILVVGFGFVSIVLMLGFGAAAGGVDLMGGGALVSIFVILSVLGGFIWFYYAMFRLQFFWMALLENRLGPIKLVKLSWGMTRGKVWMIFKYDLALMGLMLLVNLVTFGLGFVVVLPLMLMSQLWVYEKLKS